MTTALMSLLLAQPAVGAADDPLEGLPDEAISLEFQEAPVKDVFLLLGDIGKTRFVLDDCVAGALTMKLQDVTLATVVDAIADALLLRYDVRDDGSIGVQCEPPDAEPNRIDMQAVDAPLSDVLEELARAGGLALQSHSCDAVRIDVDVRNAPPRAVLRELAAQAGAHLESSPERTEVRCDPPS
ncbi:MAG: hypothetical protein AAGA54_14060 [Myxococcota bacterium]